MVKFNLKTEQYEKLLAGEPVRGWTLVRMVGKTAMYVEKNHRRWYVDYYFEELHSEYVGDYTPPPLMVSSSNFTKLFRDARKKRTLKNQRWFDYSKNDITWRFRSYHSSPNVEFECIR